MSIDGRWPRAVGKENGEWLIEDATGTQVMMDPEAFILQHMSEMQDLGRGAHNIDAIFLYATECPENDISRREIGRLVEDLVSKEKLAKIGYSQSGKGRPRVVYCLKEAVEGLKACYPDHIRVSGR